MNPSAGIVVADRYRLERPLGQGGMGAVWLAYHVGLRIPCAVKFIHAHAAAEPEVRARFEREAVAAAQLRSPHVVQILDHGIWEEMPYIAMEMLEGEDLLHRIKRVGPLPPAEVLRIVTQVARALTKAHAAGLVHRDLKPANIFLVRDDDQEIAKVLDFGIAKVDTGLAVDGQTKTGSLLGTPHYMSPEQAQGAKTLDHRSDLWALAVVTFQCTTGKLPFTAEALGELFMRIMVRPLPVPSQIGPVPPGFDAWWIRAASREPADRFQTAKELAEALSLAMGLTPGLPITTGDVRPSLTPPLSSPQLAGGSPRPIPEPDAPATDNEQTHAMGPLTPGAALGPPSGMSASVGPASALSVPGLPVRARSRGVVLAVLGVAVAAGLALGAFLAWPWGRSAEETSPPAPAQTTAVDTTVVPASTPAPSLTATVTVAPTETPSPATAPSTRPAASASASAKAPAAPKAAAGPKPPGGTRDLGF